MLKAVQLQLALNDAIIANIDRMLIEGLQRFVD